jgi:hypothetical protein
MSQHMRYLPLPNLAICSSDARSILLLSEREKLIDSLRIERVKKPTNSSLLATTSRVAATY